MSGLGRAAAQGCLLRPLPSGDSAGVRAMAARAGGLAAELRRVSGRLTDAAQVVPGSAGPTWSGAGQRSFAHSVEAKLPQLGLASARYEAYGTALLSYAAVLDRAQPELTGLRRQLADGCSAAGPVDPAADDRLRMLARRFDDAWQEWDRALWQCIRGLRRASTIDRDRHGWSSVAHGVIHGVVHVLSVAEPLAPLIRHPGWAGLSQALGNLGSELAVAGLVLLAVCPPAAAACFTAAAVLSAAQLVTDSVRAGQHQPGAGIGLLGLDALGALPGGRFVREGEQGVTAIRAARAIGKRDGISRLVPGGGLAAHEAAGGHTLEKHVGKDIAFLEDRLRREDHLKYSSSFYSREHAENAISDLLESHRTEIDSWLTGGKGTLALSGKAARPIGITLVRGHDQPINVIGVLVRLRRDPLMPAKYRIHTAFPEL
ncbi:MAG TPA: RNase A-like domain-containing protein [Jatrophihabitans sp.]|nr:RNase A-like domain-containing protein [Jatrophihabitans sp.]